MAAFVGRVSQRGEANFASVKLINALEKLGATDVVAMEAAAESLLQIGHLPARAFHNSPHFLRVSGGMKPLESETDCVRFLAGQFHDAVYCKVVGGFTAGVADKLAAYVEVQGETIRIRENVSDIQPILSVFGFEAGQVLNPYAGQNEFLSALLMHDSCGRPPLSLSPQYILAAAAHIEGTIPFREADCFEKMQQRLVKANALLPKLDQLSAEAIESTMHSAVAMANEDVRGFRNPYSAFERDTLKLARESIPMEDRQNLEALQQECNKQAGFLAMLKETNRTLYHSYAGEPESETLNQWQEKAMANIGHIVPLLREGELLDKLLQQENARAH